MYNSVIECVKVSNIFIGLKKDLFGLVWKVWLYRSHSKSNQVIKIAMTITTVLPLCDAPLSIRFCTYPILQSIHRKRIISNLVLLLQHRHHGSNTVVTWKRRRLPSKCWSWCQRCANRQIVELHSNHHVQIYGIQLDKQHERIC